MSWAEFAKEIFEQAADRELMSATPTVNDIGTADYPTPAARPANSRLDCSKLKGTFGIEPDDWKSSLGLVLDELKRECRIEDIGHRRCWLHRFRGYKNLIQETDHHVLNLDKLTYAGNLESLSSVEDSARYDFEQADICDYANLTTI